MISDQDRLRFLNAVLEFHEKEGRELSGKELMKIYASSTSQLVEEKSFNQNLKILINNGDIQGKYLENQNGLYDAQNIQITNQGEEFLKDRKSPKKSPSKKWLIGILIVCVAFLFKDILGPVITHQLNRYLDHKFQFDVEKKGNDVLLTPKENFPTASGDLVVVSKDSTEPNVQVTVGKEYVKETREKSKVIYSIRNLPQGQQLGFSFSPDDSGYEITDAEGRPIPFVGADTTYVAALE